MTVDQDNVAFGFNSFAFGMFGIEIFLASISKEDYFLSFFFWLDVVSTVSMIADIGWIWDAMIG